jgi:hypothetical protein
LLGQARVQIKPLELGDGYMFRKLGKLCVATLEIGIVHMLLNALELSSTCFDESECVLATFFALVLA